MNATKAYYLFWFGHYYDQPELKQYMLDKRNILGCKIAIISNIMLGIKEDLIENQGERNYRSKVFLKSLEATVDNIATKVSNGYKIGDYVFPDAETLVAIIRNKLAHGNFVIDFDHGRVTINHQGTDIVLSVYKLSSFIALAFQTMLRAEKTKKYVREMVIFTDPMVSKRSEPLKTPGEIKRIIKGFVHFNLSLESLDGTPVPIGCITLLENLMKYINSNILNYKKSNYYKEVCDFYAKHNCKLTIKTSQLTDPKEINELLDSLTVELLHNNAGHLHRHLETIGLEFHKK